MVRSPVSHRFTCCLALAVLAGCSQVKAPALPDTLPTHWRNTLDTSADAPVVDLQGWWKSFQDPHLDQLVAQAISQNLTITQATSRLGAVRTLASHADDTYLPQLSLSAHSSEQVNAVDTYYQVSLDTVWDLGLFGRREADKRQTQAKLATAFADAQAARVAVVAEIVRNYLELRTAQQQIQTLEALVALDQRALDLLEVRVANHLDKPDQRLQLKARQAETMARLSAPRKVQARTEHSLAALLGLTTPDPSWGQFQGLPTLRVGTLQQVPSDLLRTRPDIRHAEAEVLQASGQLGVAQANLYPHVALGISYLFAYNMTQHQNVRFNSTPMIGPIIDVPLFDWGQRKAAVKAHRYAQDAAVDGYRQVLLDGVAQTEAALAALNQEQARVLYLQQAAQAVDERSQHKQALSQLGLASEWDLLGGQRERLETNLKVSSAQAGQNLAFVALYKALGGAPLPADTQAEPRS